MRYKSAFIFCVCILFTLAGCATAVSNAGTDSSDSMLIIGASLHRMDPDGHVYQENYLLDSLSVKNLDTAHVYNIGLTYNHAVSTLPQGIYCVNTISPYSNITLDYCGKPFFKLDPGKVVNAGYFVFAIDYPHHRYKLTKAFSDPQGLYGSLTKMEQESINRFIGNHKHTSK